MRAFVGEDTRCWWLWVMRNLQVLDALRHHRFSDWYDAMYAVFAMITMVQWKVNLHYNGRWEFHCLAG